MYIKNVKGQIVGQVVDNKYISHRRPEHFFRKYQGFGISKYILTELASLNIEEIIIVYTGKQGTKHYEFTLEEFLDSDIVFNYHGEKQKVVSINTVKGKINKQIGGNQKLF